MKLPFATELPHSLRMLGRAVVPRRFRPAIAAQLQHLAHRQARKHPQYRASLERLNGLRDAHRGETCVILGNGPSLATHDLAEFEGLSTFCLNRGYLKWNEDGLTPTYAVAVNDLVIEQFHDELAALRCPVFVPWQYHHLFDGRDNIVFIEARWQERFFADVTEGVWPGATVTFAAMQIAFHMGFKTVILVGVDHRFAQAGPAHLEVVQDKPDVDHFVKDYFGKGVRWNLPDLEQSEISYRLARKVYEADSRRIVDATRDGALTVFEKMPLDEALAEARQADDRAPGSA
ncbi:MAG: 6-hydroxymethylpterin diphosphokinase MptE-like protein [Methyloligella sp. ZOD6]